MGEECSTYKNWVGKSEEKKPIGKPRHRWDDNIKINLTVFWIGGCELVSFGLV
jgi:hypothetical protein